MARTDDEKPWTRQLLVGLAVLLVVALVIGGVVSVVALGAVQVSGIGSSRAAPAARPSLNLPSGQPTTKLDTYPDPAGSAGGASASPTTSPTTSSPSPTKKPKPISLQAFPQIVAPNQRITLTGVYPGGHEGAQLQVQQFLNGWVEFPVRVTVRGGLFDTYVTPIRRCQPAASDRPGRPSGVQRRAHHRRMTSALFGSPDAPVGHVVTLRGRDCGFNGVSGPTRRLSRRERCRDDYDTGRHDREEEARALS